MSTGYRPSLAHDDRRLSDVPEDTHLVRHSEDVSSPTLGSTLHLELPV